MGRIGQSPPHLELMSIQHVPHAVKDSIANMIVCASVFVEIHLHVV